MPPAADGELPAAVVQARRHARASGLLYVSDTEPGIRRRRRGAHFHYLGSNGRPVTAERTLDRIRRLAIPPAYTDVWICREPRGHLQATGRDARQRKQYRYHPQWRETRDNGKFARMIEFGAQLPRLRRRLKQDLALPGTGEEQGARDDRAPARRDVAARRQRRVRALEQVLRTDDVARPPCDVPAGRPRVLFVQRQERPRAGAGARRSPARAHHPPLPAVARSTAVPVCRRRGQAPAGRLRHGQRLSARGDGRQRRRIHRQGFPHLGRDGARALLSGLPLTPASA